MALYVVLSYQLDEGKEAFRDKVHELLSEGPRSRIPGLATTYFAPTHDLNEANVTKDAIDIVKEIFDDLGISPYYQAMIHVGHDIPKAFGHLNQID